MANLRAIRKRISSVKNTRQITKAMKLVAGAKLKRATDAAIAARPYSAQLRKVLGTLVAGMEDADNPLLQQREQVKTVRVLVFGSDRGLCGGFNATINRRVELLLKERQGQKVELVTVGRKPRDYFRRRGMAVLGEFSNLAPAGYAAFGNEVGLTAVQEFMDGQIDEVILVYNQFRSALVQEVTAERLLPLTVEDLRGNTDETQRVDLLLEPTAKEILNQLLPQLIANRLVQCLLESTASEHGARMTAMDNATRNASDVIDRLTLEYNRARQAAITKELVEIVSGAEAL